MAYLPPNTDTELDWYLADNKRCVLLFIKYKLIHKRSVCRNPRCGSTCSIVPNTKQWQKNKYLDPYHYVCGNPRCRSTHSIRTNSIYHKSQLSLSTHLRILYKYCASCPVSIAAQQLKQLATRKTISTYYAKYRRCLGIAVDRYYADPRNKLGRNAVIEIDESKFNKKAKHHRGRQLGQPDMWVLGLVERNTGRCYLIHVPDRTTATLVPIIQRIASAGCGIMSDLWRAYLSLGDEGFVHLSVNHSVQFVDPLTGAHTNTIEGLWGNAKDKFKQMHGIQRGLAQSYLNEFMFRRLYGGSEAGLMAHTIWLPLRSINLRCDL
eukprot:15655_1